MTTKPETKRDDPEQSERFIKTAKELGASQKKEDADRAFKRVTSPKERKARS